VFLSHSHLDNRFASRLTADLQVRGVDVWVDPTEIQHDGFLKRINEGLKDREWLVLVMTPAALASPWAQLEVDAAHALVIMKRMRGVIPVMAKPCQPEDIPPTWATLHRYDATRDYRRALTSLSHALGLGEPEATH
jgi:TIR domain